MADQIYDAQVNVNYGDALAQTRDLNAALGSMDQMFRVLSDDGDELETTFLRQIDQVNRLRGNIDDITDQLKLFGEGGVQAANSLEEIADPSRRAAAGLQLVKLAAEVAGSAESKLADEAAVLAAQFELQDGATKRLLESTRRLKPTYAAAMAEVEKITDGTRRAAAAQQLFAKATTPVSGMERTFAGLGDEVAGVRAQFATLPPLMQGAVLGAIGAVVAGSLALATAVGTTLVGAWQAWAAQSREAQEVQQDLDESTSRLQVSLGRLTEQLGRVTDAQAGVGVVADETTGVLDRFNGAMASADPRTRAVVNTTGDLTRQMGALIPGVGALFSATGNLTDVFADLGEEERKITSITQAANPALLLLAATLDRGAVAALGAGDGVITVDNALKAATVDAWRFNASLRELEDRWERIEQWDAPAAVQAITGAAGGAEGEDKSRRAKAAADADRATKDRHDNNLKRWSKEIQDRQKALKAVADMDREFREAETSSGGSKTLIDKYKDDPTIQQAEAVKDRIQQGKDAAAAKRAEAEVIREANAKIQASYDETNAAMSAAANGAISFGVDTAAGIAQALIAGDSLGGMWRSALADLGTFARNTGQTLILAGLGKQALELGLPGSAVIGIGLGMVGLGVTLGGLFGGAKGGGGSSPRPQGQIAQQREAWTERNNNVRAEGAAPQVTVVAQFGDDRLEPTVTRLERSARRNGRTSSGGRY